MGLAEALFEEHVIDAAHGGRHAGPSLLHYRLPTALDVPPIEAMIVEAPDPQGPYGAKEAGEGPLHSSIPALANAVYDAIGVRIDALPLTPPRVIAALEARARREEAGDLPPHKAVSAAAALRGASEARAW